MAWKIVRADTARALAAIGMNEIWARSGKYGVWVFCNPEDSALYDFEHLSDEQHYELNINSSYRVKVDG